MYVSVAGTLADSARTAAQVAANQPLATLADQEMELEIARLRGQRNAQRTRLENLRRQQVDQPAVGSEIPTAEAALGDLERGSTSA